MWLLLLLLLSRHAWVNIASRRTHMHAAIFKYLDGRPAGQGPGAPGRRGGGQHCNCEDKTTALGAVSDDYYIAYSDDYSSVRAP